MAVTWHPTKMRYWYEGIADQMLADPGASLVTIAKRMGRSYPAVLSITNSDTFQTYFAERRRRHTDIHDAKVREQLYEIAELAHGRIIERLKDKRTVPLLDAQAVASKAIESLLGPRATPGGVTVNVQQVAAPPMVTTEALGEAQRRLRAMQQGLATEGGRTSLLAPVAVEVVPASAASGEEG